MEVIGGAVNTALPFDRYSISDHPDFRLKTLGEGGIMTLSNLKFTCCQKINKETQDDFSDQIASVIRKSSQNDCFDNQAILREVESSRFLQNPCLGAK